MNIHKQTGDVYFRTTEQALQTACFEETMSYLFKRIQQFPLLLLQPSFS